MAESSNKAKPTTVFNNKVNPNGFYRTSLSAKTLDNGIMSVDEEKHFNTYRYWTPFLPPMEGRITGGGSADNPEIVSYSAQHVKSLFNNYSGVRTYDAGRVDINMPLLDNPESRKQQRENHACTIKDLVDASASGEIGRAVYNYSDFAYCKHLGKIPNNYLVTLRRFAVPCGDKIDRRKGEYPDKPPSDLGRLVTWIGTPGNEMGNFLKYAYGVRWKKYTAGIDDQQVGSTNSPLEKIFNLSSPKYRAQVFQGRHSGGFPGQEFLSDRTIFGKKIFSFEPPYPASEWGRQYDQNKVYGPIDVIDTVQRRDRGLDFEMKFSITFDYELRSYYGVNGKSAMMDLLANILAVTYTHGKFWGGAHNFYGQAQDNVFANLPIFKLANGGKIDSVGQVIDALSSSISQTAKNFYGGLRGKNFVEKLVNFGKDLAGMLLGGALNTLGRPQKMAVSSLVNGAPAGCWHLTIGNPRSPIIEIGNLICTRSEVEHYGPLGLDDFPTGLRVKIDLEPSKPKDLTEIEKMYDRGDSRIYTPMGNKVMDIYKNAQKIPGPNDTVSASPTAAKTETAKDKTITTAKNDNAQEQMNSPAMAETAKDTSNQKPISKSDNNFLMRFFGIDDEVIITRVGAEGMFGAEPSKTNSGEPSPNEGKNSKPGKGK